MKESDLRSAVIQMLKPLHAVPVESPMTPGIPDVNCTAGWIELKHLNVWPKNPDNILQPRHFEPEQRLWLKKRIAAGGRAFVLLRVSQHWLLCWGRHAADNLGVSWTAGALRDGAPLGVACWPSQPTAQQLIYALMMRQWPM